MKRTLETLLKGFFPNPKTRSIAKAIIGIMFVAVILVFALPEFATVIKLVAGVLLAIFVIAKMEKGFKSKENNDKDSNIVEFKKRRK